MLLRFAVLPDILMDWRKISKAEPSIFIPALYFEGSIARINLTHPSRAKSRQAVLLRLSYVLDICAVFEYTWLCASVV